MLAASVGVCGFVDDAGFSGVDFFFLEGIHPG
jgi:hypothetical protein